MLCYKIKLNSVNDAENFSRICSLYCKEDVDVSQGKYLVNGKSILGLLSLDLLNPMFVQFETDDENFINQILQFTI